MGFVVEWCDERTRYVGRSTLWPLYEYYAESAEEAMMGIIRLVQGLDEDHETTDVDPSLQFGDTQEVTNVCWPPTPIHPSGRSPAL